jgi:hypothetical protein
VGILIEVIYTRRIERRRPALHAMDFIAFGEQQFGEVRAVLARDAGDESTFGGVQASMPRD